MNKKITLLALKCLLVLAFTQVVSAQQIYTNGGLSTGATSNNGVAAPVGYTWSELQNNVGNTTETNASTGTNCYYNPAGTLNYRLADNFVVPAGSTWNTTSFDFFCYQSGYLVTVPPIDVLRVQIYSSDPSIAGAVSVAGNMTTNVYDAANSSDALMYRTANSLVPTILAPVTTRKIWKVRGSLTASLPPGTYWVVYQVNSTLVTGTCLTPYVTVVGNRGLAGWNAKSQNVVTSVWSSLIDLGNPAATAPDVPQDLPFNINGTVTAGAPTNDNCSGAIALTPGGVFATNPLNSTNLNATTTAGLVPSCQTNSVNEVWYSVVVPPSGNITIEAQANGGLTNSIIVAYSGTCSTTLIPVGCNDDQGVNLMSKLSLTGQTPASTLLIALSRYSLGLGVNGTFVISAYDASLQPPSNNNCTGAIALTPGGVFADNTLNSTNLYATTIVTFTPSCQSSVVNDVWYSVVVPASGNITIEAQANGGLTDSVIVAYSGGTCGPALTPVGCNDNQGANMMSKLSVTGQTPGSTLLISLWRYSLGTGVDGTFLISAYDASLQPPSNDNCSGAIVLTPGGVFANNSLNSTNLNATTTAGLVPSCQTNSVNEVWYSVVVPPSGNITIEAQANGGLTNSIIVAYSGTCSTTLIPVGCNDDQGVNLMSKLSLTGQTPASTLLIALSRYSLGLGVNGTFVISAYDASLANNTFSNENFSAYPNPVKDILNLSYTQEISNIEIYNMFGQQVMAKTINATQSQVDMSQLASGTYMVKVFADNQEQTIKVIKE